MNTFVPSPGFDASRFKGTTLILPSVSIGNVPQLATDLLLTTLKLDRVGCIEDENVIPVLGPADRPHDATASPQSSSSLSTGGLSLAVEVFQSKDGKWTIIQQRSPTVRHRSHHYADNLLQFIRESEFDQVVLLASADGARRIDTQLRSGTPVRYILSPAVPTTLIETLKGLGLEPLESVPTTADQRREDLMRLQEHHSTPTLRLSDNVEGMELDNVTTTNQPLEKVPRIPSGGIARRLHSLCQEQGIAILTVVKFAMEGDNAPDAIFLANVLNAIFKVYVPTQQQTLDGEGWKMPKSWDSLYGNSYHQDMYQ
ncbi:Proteasome assembly chaperone 2 [Entomortierella chlamydospora]|uniref:Proteasome assembly chaperone 2 n=1 Tax=Entomortierella chlamydospora TaxID=101097 RepID=A0A9P6T1U3_9FUNG|nr:Proteasome assembly chaperone 2 [Entomortierella chlamydospora]KAG0018820.1 Proteasome assembly chaperone 2 [Entomortierella chlamydospora]